ncbi:GvpL/GvpF family gas vesicle protein [Sphaerisporangium corydalis]|uniref:GvpL/GvpF family gas vesicle protein n=1 Tax=Sphaerisporangium corydalis TaxID=1441875 RepID=A0ABV9ECX3_9ACTN|nr:GvpL/GvpF family gas vesicle protein [Sphaerisporangium corydalis]
MADTGTYLYAVTRAGPGPGLDGLAGVAGAPVHAVEHAGLLAYVSTVPLGEFGEGPLRRSLEDLDWVGETARAHHHVVETVAGTAPTAPVRLVTVYSGEAQVREMLDRRHDDFAAVLARVTGCQEWGVKAYAERPAAPPAGPAAAPQPAASASPGTDYLKRRKASLRDRDDAWRRSAEHAERVHGTLADVSVATRRHRPQDPQLSGRDDQMLLNGAYLVEEDRRDEFAALLDLLREPGIEIELTGPWAPYSFTDLEPDGRPREAPQSRETHPDEEDHPDQEDHRGPDDRRSRETHQDQEDHRGPDDRQGRETHQDQEDHRGPEDRQGREGRDGA